MKPKTYGIILLIFIFLVIVWNIVNFFITRLHRQATTPTPITSIIAPGKTEKVIAEEKIFLPSLSGDGKSLFGLANHGTTFVRFDLATGERKQIFSEDIDFAPDFVKYAPNGSAAIAHQRASDGRGGRTVLFRFDRNNKTDMNPKISDVSWTSDSQNIIYLFDQGEEGAQLSKAKPDGSDFHILVQHIDMTDPQISLAPDGHTAALSKNFIGLVDEGENSDYKIELFHVDASTTEKLPVDGFVSSPVWSPDSKKIAYLRSDKNPETRTLAIFDLSTQKETKMDITTTQNGFVWQGSDELIVDANQVDINGFPIGPDTIVRVDLNGKQTLLPSVTTDTPPDRLVGVAEGNRLVLSREDFPILVPIK